MKDLVSGVLSPLTIPPHARVGAVSGDKTLGTGLGP